MVHAQAAADSHVLDHACRAALWLADFVGGEQAACTAGGAAAQEQEAHHEIGTATLRPVDLGQREKKMGSICDRLRSMRKDINKVKQQPRAHHSSLSVMTVGAQWQVQLLN